MAMRYSHKNALSPRKLPNARYAFDESFGLHPAPLTGRVQNARSTPENFVLILQHQQIKCALAATLNALNKLQIFLLASKLLIRFEGVQPFEPVCQQTCN
jgi:hypothetical protein